MEISQPERIRSVAIQNATDLEGADESELAAAHAQLLAALDALGLDDPSLAPRNYLSAAHVWHSGGRIGS